jgi:hypothetical protein
VPAAGFLLAQRKVVPGRDIDAIRDQVEIEAIPHDITGIVQEPFDLVGPPVPLPRTYSYYAEATARPADL